MEDHSKQWYRQGLGPRVDALESALKLLPGDAAAAKHIRMIAESLRVSSVSYGFTDIFEAARNTEEAPDAALVAHTRALVATLRAALAGQPQPRAAILLIGERSPFMDAVSRGLEANGKDAVPALTAAQAQELLTQREFVFIVLDLVLPDQDGRHLLELLRSKPVTAAIPIVVLAPKVNEEVLGRRLVPDVDGCFGKPADAKQVVDFIMGRLRRAHEVTRDARRDPLTGLLNRAAFCELFDSAVKFSSGSREPLALVLLEVDGQTIESASATTPQCGHVLQEVAAVLSSSFRATDLVARWSPLQFAVLFPGEDQFGAIRAVEKALQTLRRRKPAAEPTPITLSGGITVIEDSTTIDKALEPAEHFLYVAKTSGGNRVVSSETKVARRKDSVLISAHADVAALLKRILEVNGFETILTSHNAEDALQTLSHGRYRLIVLEEGGPGADGLGLLKRIRENPRFNRIPVIMLSTREAHAAQALDNGANDYVLKPFSPFVFIARVRHLLTRGIKPQAGPRTLLLADADLTTLIVTGTALHKNAGLCVLLTRTVNDMLQRLETEEPDVLLLDAHLPDGDIHTYLPQAIKLADPNHTNIILAAPAHEEEGLERLGGKAIRGVLSKPFNLQNLVGELGELLNHKFEAGKADETAAAQLKQEIQHLLPGGGNAAKT
jgi:diguanylate cyclase (GGDEF)-like protein